MSLHPLAEDVVRELFGLWNDGQVNELDRCLAPVVDHDGTLQTLEEIVTWHRQDREVWSGTTYEILSLVSDGRSVAVRWRAEARHAGPWGPVPPTGRRVSWDGVHFFTVDQGRVVSLWAMADMFAKAQQLGVVMQPPSRPTSGSDIDGTTGPIPM